MLAFIMFEFAQADPLSLSGGAGWLGAGLLGAVLGWLLFVHLPAKDKQLKEFLEGKDLIARELAKIASDTDGFRRADFKEQLQLVVIHCEKEMSTLTNTVHAELLTLQGIITELRHAVEALAAGLKAKDK